jgi:hypothetical protein
MSKGLSPLKLGYAPQRHLPFVVVRSVPRRGTGLLFSSHVKAKILNPVVGLVAVHVIHKFAGCKRPSEMHGHNPSVFKHERTDPFHSLPHKKIIVGDGVLAEGNVAAAHDSSAGWVSRRPKLRRLFSTKPARPTSACEIRLGDLVSEHPQREPALGFAVGTSYFQTGTRVSVNRARHDVVSVNGRVRSRKRTSVFVSGQNKQLSVSTATGRAYNIRGAHHV